MAHPNEAVLRRGYDAFKAGDLDTVLSIFSEDIVLHIGGSSQISGDHRGHQQAMSMFGKIAELSEGTYTQDIHDILANDTHGAVMLNSHGHRAGQSIDAREVHIWHLADGKLTEGWTMSSDQATLDALFA